MNEQDAKTLRLLIIGMALLLTTGICSCSLQEYMTQIKAFEQGYCRGPVVGISALTYHKCEVQQ